MQDLQVPHILYLNSLLQLLHFNFVLSKFLSSGNAKTLLHPLHIKNTALYLHEHSYENPLIKFLIPQNPLHLGQFITAYTSLHYGHYILSLFILGSFGMA